MDIIYLEEATISLVDVPLQLRNDVFVLSFVLENCSNDKEMIQFLQIINVALRDLQLEIRKSVDENNGEQFYVLVN